MRRVWSKGTGLRLIWLFSLALLGFLASCEKSGFEEERKIAEFYRSDGVFTALLTVTLDHGDHTTTYRLNHTYQTGEGHTMTVSEPADLAGLTVRAGEEEMTLEYAGMLFAPEDMIGTSATPVKLLPALYKAWGMGIAENVSFEKTEEGMFVVLDIFSKVDGDEFLLRTWFDESTLLPKKAEAFFDGRRVLACQYDEAAKN